MIPQEANMCHLTLSALCDSSAAVSYSAEAVTSADLTHEGDEHHLPKTDANDE